MSNNSSSANATDFLGSTSITSSHVQQAFREYLKDDKINLLKVDAQTIAAGQGFTSFILRLTLTWSEEDEKNHTSLPKSVILKALSKVALEKLFETFKLHDESGGGAQQEFNHLINMGHKTECYLYGLFCKDTPPVPIPRAYATWDGDDGVHPPMIILEDLGDRARVLGDGSLSLNYQQLLSIAEAQADLHVWSMTAKEKGWREKLDKFEDRLAMFKNFMSMMIGLVEKAKQTYPEAYGSLDNEKLMALFEPEVALKYNSTHKPHMPDILVHGDFWANNMMFNTLPDGSMGNDLAVFIDWQMSFVGHPMTDFGRLFSMSCDSDLRENHLDDVIKHYYECLSKKLGKDMPKELTIDRVLQMAHEHTAFNCLMMFFMQDTMQSLFAPADGPESEIKRERMIKTTKKGFEYAAKILDITVPSA